MASPRLNALPSAGELTMLLLTVSVVLGSAVSTATSPGVTETSGLSGSEVVPLAVAVFTTWPARTSASVTTWVAVNTRDAPGASESMAHSSPVSSSVTTASVTVRLPVLVAVIW